MENEKNYTMAMLNLFDNLKHNNMEWWKTYFFLGLWADVEKV